LCCDELGGLVLETRVSEGREATEADECLGVEETGGSLRVPVLVFAIRPQVERDVPRVFANSLGGAKRLFLQGISVEYD
jgi:hypothetical protein